MDKPHVRLARGRGAIVVHQDQRLNIGQLTHRNHGVILISFQRQVGGDHYGRSGAGRNDLDIVRAGRRRTGDGQFDGPRGVAVDGDGFGYVVDTGNDRVQKFTSDGSFVTKWGTTGTGDGQFDNPWALSVRVR